MFGIKSGPLVWGRIASLAMRATGSLYLASRLPLQCYVDDPILVTREAPEANAARFLVVTLLWSALGLKLALRKGSRGAHVQ